MGTIDKIKSLVTGKNKELWNTTYTNKATEDDIYYCFRLILGRNPSKEEWAGHLSSLVGKELKDVMLSYLTSTEFKARNIGDVDIENVKLVDIFDYKMYLPINDPQVGSPLYENKIYEPHITNFFKNNVKNGDCFFDLGANIGYFTFLVSSLVGADGKVYAFEPYSENVKFLSLTKQVNNFDNIEILPMAVSNQNGLCLFDNSGSNGFIRSMNDQVSRVLGSTPVYSIKLDSFFSDIDRMDYIKIDTEGAEYLAVNGGSNSLKKFRPTIVTEFSPDALLATSNISAEEHLNSLLIDDDYQLYAFHGMDLISCNRDINSLMSIYEESGVEHIDIISSPNIFNELSSK